MTLDPEFVADCPYGPGGLLIDAITEVDAEQSLLRATMPAHADLPLTREQRAHPVRHPRHVSGGLMVHMTGMLGFAHAYHILGLRHRDGWIGYGGRIYDARFLALADMDAPVEMSIRGKRQRRSEKQIFSRYDFEFVQRDKVVYRSDQAAMWMLITDEGAEGTSES